MAIILLDVPVQPVPHDWFSYLDRFGVPTVLLAIILWFLYKNVIPFIMNQIEANRKLLADQVEIARKDLKEQADKFLIALERRDDILKNELTRIHDCIDRRNQVDFQRDRIKK